MSSNSQIIRGFTAEQNHSFTNILLPALQVMLRQAFDKYFNPLQPQQKQSVIMPKPAQLSKQEQEHRPLQQANVEKTAEKFTEKTMEKNKSTNHSSPIQAGTLSIIPHQATMHICGEPSPRLSNTPVFATFLTSLLAFASPLGYTRFAKDMEAIGQG
ncbi:hypothetical protein HO173_003009 [Letharia columbiana]|uniref:Uncharacterized protein n=1 Tax=Letharia columbiana TaxID=112416 RepID=A0A8H6FPH6_9LECA|nr:uncharacterized protein HO173_009614 [Letharia columbiana]XP_037168432.1 uncharacterized protein HO173_003009 [Letharia columbiana]KAF6232231.1 hypothetical protein HO173_009614 [Letharia columbiana]KAF6239136.1 hypothetical protein HO173_003009 [Letharia columbiana]